MSRIWICAGWLLAAAPSLLSAHQPSAAATYLGNEGVLVARGETKVVFDAFYDDSYGQYTLVPDTIVSAMMAGEPPYDGVDAVLVSHVHGDHFAAGPAVAYLRAHPEVPLYGSQQTLDKIAEFVGEEDSLLARIIAVDLKPEDPPVRFDIDGLVIEAVAIPHAGNRPEIQNLSWRVTLDGKTTVTHFGDAGVVMADFDRHAEHFAARRSQAAFPPYWFYGEDDGRTIIDKHFHADQVVGVHVPAAATGHGEAARARFGADLFTDPGESRSLEGAPLANPKDRREQP